MEFEQFIEDAYHLLKNRENVNYEINMWREKYINENMKEDTSQAKTVFRVLPSSYFICKDPDFVRDTQCRIKEGE